MSLRVLRMVLYKIQILYRMVLKRVLLYGVYGTLIIIITIHVYVHNAQIFLIKMSCSVHSLKSTYLVTT